MPGLIALRRTARTVAAAVASRAQVPGSGTGVAAAAGRLPDTALGTTDAAKAAGSPTIKLLPSLIALGELKISFPPATTVPPQYVFVPLRHNVPPVK